MVVMIDRTHIIINIYTSLQKKSEWEDKRERGKKKGMGKTKYPLLYTFLGEM
jgi:hypothetical protein